jgi:tetratricopeptide (TPR) repeat protein
MQADQLLNMIRNPQAISAEEVTALRKLLYQYPYFQLAFTLIAKAAYDQDPTSAHEAIQLAAVYATDRNHLKLLLENKLPFSIPKKESFPEPVADTPAIPLSKGRIKEGNEEPEFINSYISTIRNRAEQKITKPKSLEQLDIIETFMQQGGQFKPVTIKEMPLEESQVDLTQTSTTLHDDLITESLAQAMLKQGKFQRALGIYSKLKLRFPEKSLTFPPLPNN